MKITLTINGKSYSHDEWRFLITLRTTILLAGAEILAMAAHCHPSPGQIPWPR